MNPDYTRQILSLLSEQPLNRMQLESKMSAHHRTVKSYVSSLVVRGLLNAWYVESQSGKRVTVYWTTEEGRYVLKALELLA